MTSLLPAIVRKTDENVFQFGKYYCPVGVLPQVLQCFRKCVRLLGPGQVAKDEIQGNERSVCEKHLESWKCSIVMDQYCKPFHLKS